MDPPWSEGEYARDVPREFEELRKREERKERISQYWDSLVADQEPKINKQSFLYVMQDLKDEGNALFKDGHYDVAWMHYRNALFIARILEMRFYHDVDKEFISTLFSNRAFCCLKKEMYGEAVQDCDSAIQIYAGNIKAYYRQVLAYKAQKRYRDALKVAQTGYEKQPNVFKELVVELTNQVKQENRPNQTVAAQISAKFGQTVSNDVPDSDWLIGTNVNVTKQSEAAKSKMPNKKGKSKVKPQQQVQQIQGHNGRPVSDENNDESDDSSDNRLSEDENFATTFKNVRKPNLGVNVDLGIVVPIAPVVKTEATTPESGKKKNSMGLDNFSPPVATGKPASKSGPSASLQGSSSVASSKMSNSGPGRTPNAQSKSKSKAVTANSEVMDLEFPLENYDFKLACKQCFVKIGEGVKGYRYVNSSHPCKKDVLIVKLRDKPGINWIKLRPRPELKFQQFGGYKICQHFSLAHPCKVGEERCTFPHNKAELDMWSLDRDGEFSITGFLKKLQDLKIESSEMLASLQKASTKVVEEVDNTPATEIPGLNYKSNKNKQQQLNITTSVPKSQPVQTVTQQSSAYQPLLPTPKQTPSLSKPETPHPFYTSDSVSKPVTSPLPQQSVQQSMPPLQHQYPQQPFGAPRPTMPGNMPMNRPPFYSYPPPPGSMPGFGYNGSAPPHMQGPRFRMPMMPPNMPQAGLPPFPHQNMIRARFPGPGQQMPNQPPPFSAPNAPSQIRPNLLETPVPKPMSAMPQMERDDTTETFSSELIENPLIQTHTHKLMCKNCFKHDGYPGRYIYQPHAHKCEENMLAMRPFNNKSSPWSRVRERKNHREFPGKYIMCNSIYHPDSMCRYGEDNCSFAHSDVEQYIWTLEKDGKFNITEFIMQNRSQSFSKGFSLNEILQKHSGYFSFICKACFYNIDGSSMICKQGGGDHCSGRKKHEWSEYKILAHFGPDGVNVINARGFLHKTAFFKICKWLHFCRNRINAECRFAHSMVERDIWMLERDACMTQEEIVALANKLLGIPTEPSDTEGLDDLLPSSPKYGMSPYVTVNQTGPGPTYAAARAVNRTVDVMDELDDMCPYNIVPICQTCWKNGKKSLQDGQKDRCVKHHANWNTNKIYLLATANREIRPLPRKIPSGFHFLICKYIREKNKCGYTGGGPCQFAHSQEELEIWQWMCVNDRITLDDLYEASKEAQKVRASMVKSKIGSGESVVSVSRTKVALPSHIQFSPHYCSYCGIQCNSQKQWDEHCASEKHNFNVNSDKEHQWNYRQPPWGLPGSSYELCSKHTQNKCQYSNVPDMYNLCRYAHSQEELDEWKERYEWRQMKRDMARQERVFSFMDTLMEKFENADSGISVITEELADVDISCMQNLVIYEEEKNATYLWTFEILTQRVLERVALLYNKDRLHFALQGNEKPCQIAQGYVLEDVNDQGRPCYRVRVQFTGTMFGSFSQWVIFDFGDEPVLVRKLSVEVGTTRTHEKVKHLRQKLQFDRWTSENREIVRYQAEHVEEIQRRLKTIYKAADSSHSVVTQHSVATELNRNNYVHKMHKLLDMEEITRHQIISSYNLCTRIELLNAIQEETHVYAHPGELFARVPLSEYLTEDTDAGKLILTSVRQVLLAPIDRGNQKVYEASIVRKDNFDYDGRGKEYIYLCLSPDCVSDLRLQKGLVLEVEIQFQMDRIWFCMMHYAIDCLKTTDVVFPDISKINPQWNEKHTLKVSSSILNPDQMQAVQHIVSERTGYTPPFVIYGPFGTGKTETLAQAAMVLLKEKPETKILICAQSNSAADLYITKHLDPFLRRGHLGAKLRRVYFRERRVNTVAPEVKRYCLLSADKSAFEVPTREDIMRHNIVIVTLGTSLVLAELGLQGYFTHIFIDEAAQSFEAETVLPLALATEKTCVVLAGDHQQMGPKVYSSEAREQKFGMSLLERLYLYYDSFSNKIDQSSPVNILLSINYRSKMEILRFISAVFYGGPDKLASEANLASVVEITPLTFYAVQGVEVQDPDSTSFYNMSEVQEIVERVEELYYSWPHEWGEKHAKDIGVVTPYYDQVLLIRKALRKRHPDLRTVTVERVNNVQGKEFRALFISTVRTRCLIDSPNAQTEDSDCDGDIGDFGFLSDAKLLNTALTRAQSFVAVVGDPVALCAIGECLQIWRTYLKHCQNMKSIQPRSITLESIKQQVYNLLNSPARERLLQISNKQKQSNRQPNMVPLGENATVKQQKGPWGSTLLAGSEPKIVNGDTGLDYNGSRPVTMENYFDDWGIDYMIEPDDIIKLLAREVLRIVRIKELEEKAQAEGKIPPKEMMIDVDEPLKIECIRVKEEDGHAVVYYDTEKRESKKKRNLMSVDNIDDEFDSDSDISDDENDLKFNEFSESQLRNMLKQRPDLYKQCIIHIQSSLRMYAEVIDKSCPFNEIQLSSRVRCGRAFDNDEVIVKILPNDEELNEEDSEINVQGEVVGILKRYIDLRYRSFVCMVEPGNTGMMVPLNRGIPKIYNLSTKPHVQRAKKGHVCVYQFTKDKEIVFSQYVKVDPANPSAQLFIVRYLKWEPKFYSPLGIVVGVLDAGSTIDRGMQILEIEHHIPKKFHQETIMEINIKYPPNFKLPQDVYHSHFDIRDKWTFTIDGQDCEDMDDALSIEEINDGNYMIGVHIADVSYFVRRGVVDDEARSRGMSLYPLNKDPIHMLPPRLSTDLCSLKPGQDRLTISIFITVSKSGEVVSVQPKRCIINSKKKFNYQEVEEVLHDPNAASDYLKSCILVLYHVSRIWRKARLGNASMYQNLDVEDKLTPEAHLMVQELMVMTNHQVAKILVERFPQTTPLRCQQPPNTVAADEWKSSHTADAAMSVALTKLYLEGSATCTCKVACTCIINYMKGRNIELHRTFDIYSVMWDAIKQSSDIGDASFIQNIVLAAENHPHLALALMKLYSIQDRSVYICSSDVAAANQGHYGLNLAPYTHFTSPIRRYMDIVVHRMVNAIIDNHPSSYVTSDIQNLCNDFTSIEKKNRQFENAVHRLHIGTALKSRPLVVHPVIEKVDDKSITLHFPTIKDIPTSKREVDHSLLQPSEKPIVNESDNSVQLKWQERIYDPLVSAQQQISTTVAILNPNRFICKIPAFHWQKMLMAIREENTDKLLSAVTAARQMVKNPNEDAGFVKDVTSEVRVDGKIKHFTEFALSFSPCGVVQVQIAANMYKGILTPVIQLMNLVQNLDVCTEHRNDPVTCFSSLTISNASRPNYPDEIAYQNAWLPVLGMEAAYGGANNGESVVIRNVAIEWRRETSSNAAVYTGIFVLPVEFCKERHIKFSNDIRFDELFDPSAQKLAESYFLDYICVRYNGLQIPDDPRLNEGIALLVNNGSQITWVGHCVVVCVRKQKNDLFVMIRLHQSSVNFPPQLLSPAEKMLCTIEWIPKTLPDRRLDYAIRMLSDSSQLARDIARGRNPVPTAEYKDVDNLKSSRIPGLANPNLNQDMAIQTALKQPFTLIQGPPGTGKSMTGVRLAYLFAQRNMSTPKSGSGKQQVLYCGPSNKSVDVIAGYLKSIGNVCPKVIRVYSEKIEHQEFPLPREPIPVKKRNPTPDTLVPADVREVALHHVIRQPTNPFSANINEYDMLFRMYPDDITEEQIDEYLAVVTQAEMQELKSADIILCTCVASASPKMNFSTNIAQIIIDECGMCSEPESMVPIILYRSVKQVVLIGDHKQLCPVILEQKAKDLGLGRSLFERYAEKALLLTTQYRMHEGIAEFPSQYFYDGKLEVGTMQQRMPSLLNIWPNGKNKPVVFCHVEGKEETLTVATEEGNVQSKSNIDEVNLVIAVASKLVSCHSVAEPSIVIMSQYRAQCATITKKLNQKGLRNINVNTVVASQGSEWDYVILTTVRSIPKSKIEKKPTNGWKCRNLGFVADNHQINVAITRARKGLIIIGNQHLLRCEKMWDNLLKKYEKDGKLVQSSEFMKLLSA